MASFKDIIKSFMARFGRRALNPGDVSEITNLEEQANNMYTNIAKTFDENIKAEGIKTGEMQAIPQYQKIDAEESKKIHTFFQGITQSEFSNYQEIEGCEGISSSGEPFQCFAEIDGSGNIIVTPNKAISITKEESGLEKYLERRKQQDGKTVEIEIKRVHGDIVGFSKNYLDADITPEQYKKIKDFKEKYTDPTKAQELEVEGKSEEEKRIYFEELKKLGIKNNSYKKAEQMSKEEYDLAKEAGSFCFVGSQGIYNFKKGFKNVNVMLNPNQEQPETIWLTNTDADGNNVQFNSYRLTNDGKYLDTSSFQIVNGKPVYRLLQQEEVEKIAEANGFDINSLYKMREHMDRDLKNDFPKEAEAINKKATDMRNRAQRTQADSKIQDEAPSL